MVPMATMVAPNLAIVTNVFSKDFDFVHKSALFVLWSKWMLQLHFNISDVGIGNHFLQFDGWNLVFTSTVYTSDLVF